MVAADQGGQLAGRHAAGVAPLWQGHVLSLTEGATLSPCWRSATWVTCPRLMALACMKHSVTQMFDVDVTYEKHGVDHMLEFQPVSSIALLVKFGSGSPSLRGG
mmetsp:Transcript_13759/g.34915  ORF Transcript_13759/g.34915 Transcript_13759/m.34915 type:complete len:104 (+) Transcript_13759:1230-1541(+)